MLSSDRIQALMTILFAAGGAALLVWNFGTLWWEERHLTTRDLYEDLGERRKSR